MTAVTATAESVVNALIQGRQAERMEAQRLLEEKTAGLNLDLARQLILDAVHGRCAPRQHDDRHAGARSWLLNSLAFVPASGKEPEITLYASLDQANEPFAWPRYWALHALFRRGAEGLENRCRTKVSSDPDRLPRFLAKAILAAAGDENAGAEIKDALTPKRTDADAESDRWATLRALRFVRLPFALEPVAAIADEAAKNRTFGDITFDAIVALGNLPSDETEASIAANVLINIITRSREFQYWDVMRIRAIEALGKLRVGHTASLLLDEITDLNPAIVKEAVLALERILDAETMSARILERLERDPNHDATIALYSNALRFLSRTEPAVNKLESAMLSGPLTTRELARRLLGEMGGSYAVDKLSAQAQGAERYLEVLNASDAKLREMFENTIDEGRRGFRVVITMDVALFVAGLVMLALAIGLATADKNIVAVVTASGGILSALYGRFFAKPREQVESSVTQLAALKAIFLGYLRQLHQIDQSFARMMLDDAAPSADAVKRYTGLVDSVMDGALEQLGTHKAIRRMRDETGVTEETDKQFGPARAKGAGAGGTN